MDLNILGYRLFALIIIVAAIKIIVAAVEYYTSTYFKLKKQMFFRTVNDSGAYGEYLLYKEIRRYEKQGAKFLFNCYLPHRNSTTEIDVLMICKQGIIVFESKNYSGWIFGSETSRVWTQSLPQGKGKKARKEKFFNPVMQNNAHIKALGEYFENDVVTYPLVVFSNKCEFKKLEVENYKVIYRNRLKKVVKEISSMPEIYDQTEVEEMYEELYPTTLVSDEVKVSHIENINNRYKK